MPPSITITQQPQDATAALSGDWSQLGSDINGEAASDYSGYVALSSDGSRVAIGAYLNDGGGQYSGHVRIYDWSGSAWVQVGADIDGEAVGDQSGYSVALSSDGSRVAIGAPYNDGNSDVSGHVRVYEWSGSAWVQVGADIDGEAAGDWSGHSVALSSDGSRVAIGAPYNDGNGDRSGHVRIYDWSGSAWVQVGADIDGEAAGDWSGYSVDSVDLSGDGSRVAIGAPYNDGGGAESGHVRIYDWSGSAWVQVGADIDGEAIDDRSGWSVALSSDGSRVAIGAVNNDGNGTDSGRVRIYDWSGSAWVQAGADIDGEAASDQSGWSVALSSDGSRVAIGAYNNDGSGTGSGHVRIYDWSGSAWVQVGADIDGEATGDYSGSSVALSGDGSRVAIGASYNDGNGAESGHVRVHELPTAPSATFSVSATSSDGSALTYQWQKSDDGVTFANVSGATSATLSLTGLTAADDNGDQYRVIVDSPSVEPVTSDAAILSVPSPNLAISSQPVDTTSDVNAEASFSVVASESVYNTAPTYQWQLSQDSGATWSDIANATSATLTLTGLTASDEGNRYRVVVTAVTPVETVSLTSVSVVLSVPHIDITTQPQNATAALAPAGDWSQLGLDIDGEAPYDSSGHSVALSSDGSRVAIGAAYNDGNGDASGHVRIYDWSGAAWVQAGSDIDGEAVTDYSGWSVALSSDGSRVAIGAYRNDGGGLRSGHVRIYDWSGTAWVQVGADIDGEAADDYSGYSVALSSDGSRVAIGAYLNDGNGVDSGHVRIYDWSGSSWVQVGADIDGEAGGDESGWSVALSGDGKRVAIGAHRNDGNGAESGHVRIYDWSGSAWVQVGADIDGEATGDYSGSSVALSSDGSRVAIGARRNDGGGAESGHVRIYDWSGSAWVQVGADIDGEAIDDRSGWSVALSSDGSRVAIGAYGNDGGGFSSGHVRIYDWSGSAWVQVGADIDGEALNDLSGHSVALSSDGSRIAIGARGNDGGGFSSGHVRIYESPTAPSATFSVSATASDNSTLTYQWQKSDDGVTFANVSGATSATLSLTGLTVADDNGDQYRVIVDSPSVEPVTSDAATLSVPSPNLAISSQPVDTTSDVNAEASFSVVASESVYNTAPTYQWQLSQDSGATWSDITNETSATLTLTGLTTSDEGNSYRVVVTAATPVETVSLTSVSVVLSVPHIDITTQPQDVTATEGNATLAVSATSSDGSALSYQWQKSDDGVTFANVAGATSSTLSLTGLTAADDNGDQYRVIVDTATAEAVTSDVATLSVPVEMTITSQPQNTTASGGEASFAVAATVNDGSALTYQWEEERLAGGVTWTQRTLPASAMWYSVTYGDGTFVAVVAANSDIAATSTDGITWTQRTLPASANWKSVTYGGGTFVAVASSDIAATSTDGVTWTQRTLPATADWISVTYGGGTFVAVAFSSNIAATSTDGITWTQRTLPSSAKWWSVTHGDGTFVAVAANSDIAATSTDGITWTQRTLPASADWKSVTYGGGTFVAVANVSNIAATSTDGITWTQRTLPASADWWSVTHGDGTFVAVAAGTIAATSTDGITWTQRTLPESTSWLSVAYGDGTFVAVASGGFNFAATSTSTLQFLPLSGETASTLNLTGLTTADDGERYRVVVDSPSVEPVTSNVATLTVT